MKFWRALQNILSVGALCALFSQGAFAQMPGTFQPLVAVAAGGAVMDCIGGTITYSGGNTIHTFTSVGTNDIACPSTRTVNYLVVGGGGSSGGYYYSGGGGAGGVLTGSGTLNAGTSHANVGAGGIQPQANVQGANGGNSLLSTPGGAGSWISLLPTPTLAVIGSGLTNYDIRTRWNQPVYLGTAPATGTQIRVTIGGGASGSNVLNAMYCGNASATSPNLDFDGSQVQIKFSGSASATVPPTASPLVSDAVNYTFSKSNDFVCSMNWGSTSYPADGSTNANIFGSYNAGGTNASNTTFGNNPGVASRWWVPVLKIEVFSPDTIVAQAIGGGGGGVAQGAAAAYNGLSGGSGGGATGYNAGTGGTGIAGQGFAGGNSVSSNGGGGGGAGAAGQNGQASGNAASGGIGVQSSITGTAVYYGGGGGASSYTATAGVGGQGGGGNGAYQNTTGCTAGAANTGGGAGGNYGSATPGYGNCGGGSGIIVVSYPTGAPNTACVGGTITTQGANTLHTFTAVGSTSISCGTAKSVNYLIVAGGGAGGGSSYSGGGGAGGLVQGTGAYLPAGVSAITVGAGGVAPASSVQGLSGGGSSVSSLNSASGGGGGGSYGGTAAGLAGGSGGGGAYGALGGTGGSGQGNSGGSGASGCGAGGGGAGAAGVNCTTPNGSNGGAGVSSSITGTSVCYAGGGAGGAYTGTGGTATCGGGNAANYTTGVCGNGAANTGGGGGGLGSVAGACSGGSGIVVISYATGSTASPPTCQTNTGGGGNFSNVIGLWHFDNNGTDQSSGAHNLTLNGGASYSSLQSKFGGYAYHGAATPSNWAGLGGSIYNGIGDFTLEFWLYITAAIDSNGLWVMGDGNDNSSAAATFAMVYNQSSNAKWQITYSGGSSGAITTNTVAISLNTWHHHAYVRQGTTYTYYLDGVAQPTTSTITNPVGNGSAGWGLGAFGISSPQYGWLRDTGWMDEVRFSNVARYAGNFSPPTVPFCNN
jgi:hypothetical protein